MSVAEFTLVRKTPVVITRQTAGSYVDGEWVEGTDSSVTVQANVHPFTDYQVMLLPESDRTKAWLWFFTADPIRHKKEGTAGYGGDRFTWNGEVYEMMKVQQYQMGPRDHFEGKAARIELTPN